jgi:hypothetical protein
MRIECRSTVDGALVSTFGTAGVVELDRSAGYDSLSTVVVNGAALYVAGTSQPAGTSNWFIASFEKTTGALLWSQTSPSGSTATSVAVDATGVYVVGSHDGTPRWTIEKRQLGDGTLVQGFGMGGIVDVASGGEATSIVADGNGGIVVTGGTPTGIYPLEGRSAQSGSVLWGKTAFASAGGGSGRAQLVLDGSLFVSVTAPGNQLLIEKHGIGGSLDTSFGSGGSTAWVDSTGTYYPGALAASGGDAYVVGYSTLGGNTADTQWRIADFDETTGALKSSFGSSGVRSINPSARQDWARAVAVDAKALYVAGLSGSDASPSDGAWRVDKIPR